MRTDFHFYAVYILATAAGIKPSLAKKIAYASEFVDDSKHNSLIHFENGGQMQPTRSAHKMISPKFFTDQTGMSIYMPFHFFPCGEGDTFLEKITCRIKSTSIFHLKGEVISNLNKSFGLHYLGLALHIIADTYAHQGFTALNDPVNDATNTKVLSDVMMDTVLDSTSNSLPPFGHMKVLTCPDEPACKWSYMDAFQRKIHADNPIRFIDAAKEIYTFIKNDIRPLKPEWYSQKNEQNFEEIKDSLMVMLTLNMPLHYRMNMWDIALKENLFGDLPIPTYDENSWFKQSIRTVAKFGKDDYYRLDDFQTSDWKLFQDALAQHVFYCRYILFPQFEVFI
jgi:hypothetical protein